MKICEIVDAILARCPKYEGLYPTCDTYKWGDPDQECSGIVTACYVSVNVIKEAAAMGANLIISHEPVFYSNPDKTQWLEKSPVFEEKRCLLDENGIVVWRFHDHMHAHRPDLIFYGVAKELGWLDYVDGNKDECCMYRLPKIRLKDLAAELKEKIGLNSVRYIGDPDALVSTVNIYGHLCAFGDDKETEHSKPFFEKDVDVLFPGEYIDWTAMAYARDAGELGMNKALMNTGHFNLEELGMKYAAQWVQEVIGNEAAVTYVKSSDSYHYI